MNKYPFPVEFVPESPQTYHGPKKRMQVCLESFLSKGHPRIAERQFVDYIVSSYRDLISSIQKVKFYKYPYNNMILHFAILWTRNDAFLRDKLFEEGLRITEQTGWYPLVTGSRIGRRERPADIHIRESLRKCMNRTKFESAFDLGIPISLEKISSGVGNAFLMKTSSWNVLFDSGIGSGKLNLDRLDHTKKTIVILSHAHADHAGGLLDIIKDKSFFIIATEVTLDLVLTRYAYLYDLDSLLPSDFFYRVFPARYDCVYRFLTGGSLSFFHSSHYPGGIMTLITFKNGKSFLYTGDFSLSVNYGAEAKCQLLSRDSVLWTEANGHIDWTLMDAALASKTETIAFGSDDQLYEGIEESYARNGIVACLIEPQDLGFFLYLDIAARLLTGPERHRIPIYVDPFVKRLLNAMDKYLKLMRIHSVWPSIQPLLIQRKNIFESVWLYEMDQYWVKNIAYHRSKKTPAFLILDYNRALKDGYDNRDEFQRLAMDCERVFFIGKTLAQESQQPRSHRSLNTSWGSIELKEDVFRLRGDSWVPHCPISDLELMLETVGPSLGRIFLFHQHDEALNAVAGSLRTKLRLSISGLSQKQNLA